MTATIEPRVEAEPATTRRVPRVIAVGVWTLLLVVWSDLRGIPNDPWGVLITLWLFTIAWNIEAPWRHHLGFLRDWTVPALLLAVYFYSRGWVDEFDITVHWTMPIDVDRWMFGGELPTTTLQQAWCGQPCTLDGPVRWYDSYFTTVYATHFVVGLTLAVVLWAKNRTEWLVWMRRYLGLNFAGLVIYIAYPMAPPWMASDEGYVESMERITSRGWGDLGLHRANVILNGVGNPVAAMPSLHAGTAMLVALYGIWRLRTAWRWLLLLYPLSMCVALVYFAEHYVVDELAGIVLAGLVMVGASAWERWRARRKPPAEPESDAGTEPDATPLAAG
ncbi:phosphatase PAP2 family protein [Nocardioides sp. C4-1]|uniref:phosphatase PAP2 family protein n=1 Tax=Nocardioides sp. C4-1 TaxID=3151851 RepID=UPI003264CC75